MDFFISLFPKELSNLFASDLRSLNTWKRAGRQPLTLTEELVDLHEFLDRLYAIALEHASKTSH